MPLPEWDVRTLLARPRTGAGAMRPALQKSPCDARGAGGPHPRRLCSASNWRQWDDDDARENYAVFLRFSRRAFWLRARWRPYLRLMRSGTVDVPAVFIDAVVQALLRNVLDTSNDALEARAAEMLFRPQRITLQEGQMLAGDRDALDLLQRNRRPR